MKSTDFHDFVWTHRHEDPGALVLSRRIPSGMDAVETANYIKSYQKLCPKVPEWCVPGLLLPAPLSVEQASSSVTARYKSMFCKGARLADLTGGLGIDSFFFADAFQHVDYVEQAAALCEATHHNFQVLGKSNIQVHHSPADQFLQQTPHRYDLIFLDPARRDAQAGRVFRLEDCSPDITQLLPLIFEKTDLCLLKAAPMLDIKQAIQLLKKVREVWVVAVDGDCRELLFMLDKNEAETQSPRIHAVLPGDSNGETITFSMEDEQRAAVEYTLPQQYLYEPDAAVMKAGAFRFFAQTFGLNKLHAATHLYTSEKLLAARGRRFAIKTVCRYDKKAVQAAVPGQKANITCRNFPDKPEVVRKKLGLADGGEVYLFACTGIDDQKMILVCSKI